MVVMEGWLVVFRLGCPCFVNLKFGFSNSVPIPFECNFPTTFFFYKKKFCRLGHREQKDEFAPRRVDIFTNRNVLPPDAIISAGSVNSACTAGMHLCISNTHSLVLLFKKCSLI